MIWSTPTLTDDATTILKILWDSIPLPQFIKENSRIQDGVSGVDTCSMRALVELLENGVKCTEAVFGDSIVGTIKEAFKLETETGIEIKQVQFPSLILVWNSTLAHNCFAEGRISEYEFIEACKMGGKR